MSFTIHTFEQRSPEWYAARLGLLTGSCANDMLATIKSGGEAAGRRNLRVRLMLERVTGKSQEPEFTSDDMQVGIDRETEARGFYEVESGSFVSTVGFLRHTDLMAGCSPDGVIGDFDGLLSVKCPKPATHLEYVKSGQIPTEYLRQTTHEMWISGAQWTDFVSFNPDFPDALRIKLVRVEAKALDLIGYDKAVRAFLAEVDREVEAVRTLSNLSAVLEEAARA